MRRLVLTVVVHMQQSGFLTKRSNWFDISSTSIHFGCSLERLVTACWERAGLLAFLCVAFSCVLSLFHVVY